MNGQELYNIHCEAWEEKFPENIPEPDWVRLSATYKEVWNLTAERATESIFLSQTLRSKPLAPT